MNDLRDELERSFKANGLFKEPASNESVDNFSAAVLPGETMSSPQAVATSPEITAPESYQKKFASDFKNLPPEWQAFLSEHENKNNKKYQQILDSLQAYEKLERLFDENRLRLQEQGFLKIQDWLEGLIWIDEHLAARPKETIMAIAKVYGVKLDGVEEKNSPLVKETIARLNHLENNFDELTSYLNGLQNQRLEDMLQMFGRQTDDEGNLLHPYFEAVKSQVYNLLAGGTSSSIEDAYESALWLNPQVRAELIEKQISSKAAEAQKAQKAAFSPKGKTEAPERPLTLREELEKNMAAFMD